MTTEEPCTCGGTAWPVTEAIDELSIGFLKATGVYYHCRKCGYRSAIHTGHLAQEGARESWRSDMKHTRHAYYGPLYQEDTE